MTTMDNIHTPSRAPLNASLMAAIETELAQLPQTPHTIESSSIRWTEPTPPEDIHPDDWINPLPARPQRLPSRRILARMSKAERAITLIVQIASCAIEANGMRRGLFDVGHEPPSGDIVRNAGRRLNRALDRAMEFGLFVGGRWHIGNLTQLIQSLEERNVNGG